ncbi:hypothetical protein HPB50_006077 [Hyalomma asiaticum]|uniref:Uncharacterized protein n=1 Tax=Hyalomma asiaticum TaxID=266040 RepID=A0ACB7STQ7_HYAAI|nr:hypothetical protein HPB50_006077 [Hyalomma asiaticum]
MLNSKVRPRRPGLVTAQASLVDRRTKKVESPPVLSFRASRLAQGDAGGREPRPRGPLHRNNERQAARNERTSSFASTRSRAAAALRKPGAGGNRIKMALGGQWLPDRGFPKYEKRLPAEPKKRLGWSKTKQATGAQEKGVALPK